MEGWRSTERRTDGGWEAKTTGGSSLRADLQSSTHSSGPRSGSSPCAVLPPEHRPGASAAAPHAPRHEKRAENSAQSRADGCSTIPGTTKPSRAWGFTPTPPHTHTHTHLHHPRKPICSQLGLSLHPPAALPRTQSGGEKRGAPRKQRPSWRFRRRLLAAGVAAEERAFAGDGCARCLGPTGTFFVLLHSLARSLSPLSLSPLNHINKESHT